MNNKNSEKPAAFSSSANRGIKIPQAAPYQLVEARHGLFLANAMDIYIGQAILNYGEYCEKEWDTLKTLVLPNKDIIEVGANVGSHSVSLAKAAARSGRRLLAIEPQPFVFQNLCANFALNGLMNVRADNVACSDVEGWVSFNQPDYRELNNFGGISMSETGQGNISVRCLPLDDLVPDDFDVGLIKIDVEGFELKVLEGSRKTIARCRPIIYVENDRVENSKELIEWLWSMNYSLWWDIPRLFNEKNFFSVTENIYGDTASFNMACLPSEWNVQVSGALISDSSQHPLK